MKRLLFTLMCTVLAGAFYFPVLSTAQETSTFYLETFDGVTPPELPAGWSDPDSLWESSSSVSSTGSGLNNVKIAGATGSAVQTSTIDLSGMTSGTLQYLARRTSSYEQDSLTVKASTDGGASFSVLLLDKGEALPATDGSYALMTVPIPAELVGLSDAAFMFEAYGGSTSGANIRIDDVEVLGSGEPTTTESTFGFASASSVADGTTGIFEVPLFLDFSNAELLQGLQLEVTWESGVFDLTDVVRGSAIASLDDWQIKYDSRDGELRVVLLGNQLSALSSGLYDPLMTLQFTVDAGNSDTESILTLTKALGALSVRTGDDAGLNLGLATHTVTLTTGGDGVFSPDVTALDFGSVVTDTQGQSVVTVTNTGSGDLVISTVTSANTLFETMPSSATLTPGAAQAFTVTFSPTFTVFGFQSSDLTFSHNGAGGSDSIGVSGTGTGGRGDMSEDGLVDASDLVTSIDLVLESLAPVNNQLQSADVFPFASPDTLLDVRDLTVLSQAILLGLWPDDSALPDNPPANAESDKFNEGLASLIQIEPVQEGDQVVLYLNVGTAIRAFQFSLNGIQTQSPQLQAAELGSEGVHTFMHLDEAKRAFNMLGADMQGDVIAPGRYALAALDAYDDMNVMDLGYALAVAADGSRLPVTLASPAATGLEEEAFKPALAIDHPFPNPYSRQSGAGLRVPFSLGKSQHVDVQVFDILGRQVSSLANQTMAAGQHNLVWDAVDTQGNITAPGLYLVRIKAGEVEESSVVVVR